MTHYDVLGVEPTADGADIRRAYLRLARFHHPDTAAHRGEGERAASEAAIRQVNAAWKVLSDHEARRRYDEELGLGQGRRGLHLDRPADRPFVPIDGDDDDDDDDWRYEDDVGDPRTAPGRALILVPIGLLAAAVVAFGAWVWTTASGFLALSVMLGAGALVGFVVAPMVAMGRARRYEGN